MAAADEVTVGPVPGAGAVAAAVPFPRRLVAGLAITQTVGYGTLYYAFSVLLRPMSRTLRASEAVVTGALTGAVLVAAAAAVPVGRWIDRHGARGVMTVGALLGAGALAAWSQVRTVPQLYAVLGLAGLASAMTLYEAAFAVVVAVGGRAHRTRAVLALTVVAGFASSIFIPLTGLLVTRLGWRDALLVLAAVHACLTVPLHAALVPSRAAPVLHGEGVGGGLRAVVRDPGYWLLNLAFVLHAAAVGVVAVHLVGYLNGFGHGPARAAALAAPLGALSVAGRLTAAGLSRRMGMANATAVLLLVQAVALGLLPHLGVSVWGAALCVAAFGLGFGVASIARPLVLADRYGTAAFGAMTGIGAAPIGVMRAVAPLGAAALAVWAGATGVLTALALCCAVAAAFLAAMTPGPRRMVDSAPGAP